MNETHDHLIEQMMEGAVSAEREGYVLIARNMELWAWQANTMRADIMDDPHPGTEMTIEEFVTQWKGDEDE